MPAPLIAPRFLFRFAAPLRFRQTLWADEGAGLSEKYRLPDLGALDGQRALADLRLAWNQRGLAFTLLVGGKQQPVWCRDSRLEDSDGIQLWIDTRATHNVHRASRFCHRLVFLPAGGGRGNRAPVADQLIIHRARENARPLRPADLVVRSRLQPDGYVLEGMIPAEAMTGFDPTEQPRLGFTYALFDRELGLQTFSTGSTFPYEEDPSTWATLELTR